MDLKKIKESVSSFINEISIIDVDRISELEAEALEIAKNNTDFDLDLENPLYETVNSIIQQVLDKISLVFQMFIKYLEEIDFSDPTEVLLTNEEFPVFKEDLVTDFESFMDETAELYDLILKNIEPSSNEVPEKPD